MSSLSPKSKPTGGIIYQATGADKDAVARSMGVDPVSEPDLFLFLCKALDARLPHPWTEHADKKGRIFYWNPASRHSSWQHPLTPSHKSLVAAYRRIMQEEDRQAAIQLELDAFTQQVEEEVGKWRQSHAPDGTPYFYKLGTQITRWDNPRDELMAHMELRVQMLDELAHLPQEGDSATMTLDDRANRTQQMLTDAIMSTSQTTLAANSGLQGPAALQDATASSFQSNPPPQPLAIQDQSDLQGSGTLRSPGGRARKGKKQGPRSQASASEASDAGSAAESPKSNGSTARSIINYLSPGARKRNKPNANEQKKAPGKDGRGIFSLVSQLSPKYRQRHELAALKVTRAAKKWLAWSRAKKSEAALVVQKSFRGWQGRKAFDKEVRRQEEVRQANDAMPPELDHLGRTLFQAMNSPLGASRSRITFERSNLLSAQGDVDLSAYIFPDEIALHHGMNFDIPVDKAIFNIIRPLLLRPLPVPWQILQRYHGRVDYFHAGVQEERRLHPLHAFFGEVILFLKAHVHTDVPMVEPMTAQVFREASPQYVRQRLGVWEGPHEDASSVGGVRYLRLLPGEDKDCPEGDVRYDDPRLEAAASVMARMSAWLHLWLGFAPEEPFPFLEGRLPALAAQISENVVVAPGAASEALLLQLRGAAPAAQLAVPAHPLLEAKEPEVLPLTREEEALQPVVTGTLGKAYGAALEYVAKLESGKLEEEKPPRPAVVEDDESEAEYTEVGEDEEEYEESFSEEDEDEEEEYESDGDDKEDTEEDISAATTAAQTPQSSRRPMQNVEALEKELAEEETEELPPKEVPSFLPGYNEQSAADWATRNLRPLTPTQELKAAVAAPLVLPSTKAKRPWHRLEPRADQEQLWGENNLLADAQERLELKEPPLADWGKLPEAVGSVADGAFVPSPVPLSPSEKERAAKALPHLAGSMKKGELLKIRQEQQDRVTDFAKSLVNANSNFDSLLGEAETPPGSPSGRWRCARQAPGDDEEFRGRRPALDRPHLPANLSAEDVQDDVCPIKGCIARANSPTKGSMTVPPHLEGATKAAKKNNLQAWPVSRSASAGPAIDRSPSGMRYEQPRPRSAAARVRPRGKGLLVSRPSQAAHEAAASCRRFLSRECGTMPLALNTFDSTGHGKFNRWEWENGLEKLGYEAHYDVQEIFTVLDKRHHHVLTLSDLLDHFNGRPIAEGLPDPGLQGIVSEIMLEAMMESVGPVVTQALAELLQKELLAPRGPPYTLPSIKAVLKRSKKDSSTRKLARNPNQPLELSGEGLLSPGSSAKKTRRNQFGLDSQSSVASSRRASTPKQGKSPPARRAKKTLTKFKTVGQLMKTKSHKGTESGSGLTPPESPSGVTITGTFNSTLSGPLGGSEKSLSGSPFRLTSSRKKGMLGSTGMRSQSASGGHPTGAEETVPSSPGPPQDPRKSSASRSPQRSRRSPSPKSKKHRGPSSPQPRHSASSKASPPRGASSSAAGSRQSKSLQTRSTQSRSSQARSENKYVGYNFVRDEEPPLREQESLGDWQREKLLPWMPRPTEDICRTYGHIFRLLNDPKTKRISEKPQKKTLHVSVPRMPTVPPGRGHNGRPDSGASDEESLGPLPSMLSTSSKLQASKSSPDLMISHLSTTAGSVRPDSAGSWETDDGRRSGINLRRVNPIDGGLRRRSAV